MRASQLLSAKSSRLIAAGRAVLALVLMLSATAGGVANGESVLSLLTAYAAFALVVLILSRSRRFSLGVLNNPLVLSGVDLVALTALLYMTSGADSPFFSPLFFLVLSALIQWGSRGAAAMGALLLAVFVPTGWAIAQGTETGRTALLQYVVRIGNIGVFMTLLIFFGRHVERVINELARLSDPVPDSVTADLDPPVVPCLQHALNVFSARRGAFVWTEDDEPWSQVAVYDADSGGSVRRFRLSPDDGEWIVHDAAPEPAFLYDAAADRTFVRRGGRTAVGPAGVVARSAVEALGFQRALVLRAAADRFEGWLFVADHEEPAAEDLAVGAMVSAQVSVAVERWRALTARRDVAAGEERIRLARDLHDGVLQFLAGASLHLDAVARTPDLPSSARSRLQDLRAALRDEQRELRGFIAAMQPLADAGRHARRPLGEELGALCERLSRHWGAKVEVTISPADAAVSADLLFDLTRIVREAVANAVRHGRASRVSIDARVEGRALSLAVADDGAGFPVRGVFSDEDLERDGTGPKSLQQRVRALGGRLQLESADTGAVVRLALPLQKAA